MKERMKDLENKRMEQVKCIMRWVGIILFMVVFMNACTDLYRHFFPYSSGTITVINYYKDVGTNEYMYIGKDVIFADGEIKTVKEEE